MQERFHNDISRREMLAALGASGLSCDRPLGEPAGISPDRPEERQPAVEKPAERPERPEKAPVTLGVRPERPRRVPVTDGIRPDRQGD